MKNAPRMKPAEKCCVWPGTQVPLADIIPRCHRPGATEKSVLLQVVLAVRERRRRGQKKSVNFAIEPACPPTIFQRACSAGRLLQWVLGLRFIPRPRDSWSWHTTARISGTLFSVIDRLSRLG